MREGAYDYIEKPLNAEKLNRLKALIPKALDKFNVQERNRELSSKLEGLTHYGELTGQSEEMRSVYQIIDAVAPSTASVMILGESGTGKELVARALHTSSDRAKGPFFALNCAALPKDILENELFGHEKGAFTGSINEKAGAFEMARRRNDLPRRSRGDVARHSGEASPRDRDAVDSAPWWQEGNRRRHSHRRGDESRSSESARRE